MEPCGLALLTDDRASSWGKGVIHRVPHLGQESECGLHKD